MEIHFLNSANHKSANSTNQQQLKYKSLNFTHSAELQTFLPQRIFINYNYFHYLSLLLKKQYNTKLISVILDVHPIQNRQLSPKHFPRMAPILPLLITTMVIGLNVTVDQINFQKSPYSQCQVVKLDVPVLNQFSQSTINEYLDRNKPGYEFYLASPRWRVLRYNVSGHIIPHRDHDRPFLHYDHIATEIYIPPTSQVQFEGGQLIIKENKQPRKILPHPTQWTYVFMPLGYVHEVTNITSGYRISYTKAVYVQKKKEQKPVETPPNSGQL